MAINVIVRCEKRYSTLYNSFPIVRAIYNLINISVYTFLLLLFIYTMYKYVVHIFLCMYAHTKCVYIVYTYAYAICVFYMW